ncbi:uncharacterized protein N0V89_012028 [Didymosphaeria variabile]|uniref:Heterokaryon incompatibility domain-containing protein n=1 Tax=Didymosphaeria variabile TaxID=1932322 RepID=A0A9W8XAT6_9PLEO|nr:uncharacterized protein N0V89_012028 [Didymosphaeria variabile]KAJ4345892.1 hypothetical protein N0V89_012028 [Didymosphaeria variabile]
MSKFDYKSCALPSSTTHIRLLQLRLAEPTTTPKSTTSPSNGSLVCELLTTPIAAPLKFKALSYTWGTAEKTSFLKLNRTQLNITPSLHTALQYIASQQEDIYLWVDQVCIDQSNGAEKSEQVLLMSDIYRKAEQTLVWLGPAADRSDELMDLWLDIGQKAEKTAGGLESYFTKEKIHRLLEIMESRSVDDPLTEPYHQLVDEARPRFEDLMQAIVDLDERPWFHRVWIVQEVSLCPDTVLVCGHKIVPVDFVRQASNIFAAALKQSMRSNPGISFAQLALQAQSHRLGPLLSTRKRRQRYANSKGEGEELFHLLRKLFVESDTRATQNRDRIYGLLALAVDAEQLGIRPDYTTLNVASIFTHVARAMIRQGRIEILSFSQFPKEKDIEGLPTWVPDWRPNLAPSYYTIFESAEEHLLGASGSTQVSMLPKMVQDVLSIRGYLIDSIEEVGNVWHASDDHASYLHLFKTLQEFCSKSATKDELIYENPLRRAEATWRVPIGDLYWDPEVDYIRARKPLVEDAYHECVKISEIIVAGERQLTAEEIRRSPSGRYRNSMSGMDGKRLYITRRGYLGMCPDPAVAGDSVVVFCGARLPYVLRARGEEDRHTFLGEAYCHGMMDGEVLGRERERTFFIE